MLDFEALDNKKTTLARLSAGLDTGDLRALTNEMIDTMLALISDATDADVVFVPEDPDANDTFAGSAEVVNLPWTLGHVVVHATASSEEAAFLAAELARGVESRDGRSRYEVPWETMTTIAQCRARLEESRRMRLASLDMWPDEPHLDNTRQWYRLTLTPAMQFVVGLGHDYAHLEQIAEIVRQAKGASQPVGLSAN
jgi:hypothetical protein